MSEHPKSAEIEDVLSSIRRLVSGGDGGPFRQPERDAAEATAADIAEEETAKDVDDMEDAPDALVLTAEQRVEGVSGEGADSLDAEARDAWAADAARDAQHAQLDLEPDDPGDDATSSIDETERPANVDQPDPDLRDQGTSADEASSQERKSPFNLTAEPPQYPSGLPSETDASDVQDDALPSSSPFDTADGDPLGPQPTSERRAGFGFATSPHRPDPTRHVPLDHLPTQVEDAPWASDAEPAFPDRPEGDPSQTEPNKMDEAAEAHRDSDDPAPHAKPKRGPIISTDFGRRVPSGHGEPTGLSGQLAHDASDDTDVVAKPPPVEAEDAGRKTEDRSSAASDATPRGDEEPVGATPRDEGSSFGAAYDSGLESIEPDIASTDRTEDPPEAALGETTPLDVEDTESHDADTSEASSGAVSSMPAGESGSDGSNDREEGSSETAVLGKARGFPSKEEHSGADPSDGGAQPPSDTDAATDIGDAGHARPGTSLPETGGGSSGLRPSHRMELSEPEDPVDNLFTGEATELDEEALRALIVEVVQRELQGDLGERVTRNIRRLVRREIARAFSARDLDES